MDAADAVPSSESGSLVSDSGSSILKILLLQARPVIGAELMHISCGTLLVGRSPQADSKPQPAGHYGCSPFEFRFLPFSASVISLLELRWTVFTKSSDLAMPCQEQRALQG